jgi:hypothetical protein
VKLSCLESCQSIAQSGDDSLLHRHPILRLAACSFGNALFDRKKRSTDIACTSSRLVTPGTSRSRLPEAMSAIAPVRRSGGRSQAHKEKGDYGYPGHDECDDQEHGAMTGPGNLGLSL